ncbi:MAG: glycosyltransferase family 4 protein [Firmicutes bacterium]|nr:glycosyltransferase family 4 protein [Bacillota bacterium]
MRIAIIYPYLNSTGGVEKVVLQEIQELYGLGHELVIFAAEVHADVALPDDVRLCRVRALTFNPLLLLFSFLVNVHFQLKRWQPFDLYHYHTFCLFPPGKTLISFHSVHTAVLRALKSPWPERWIRKFYPIPIVLEYLTCKLFQNKKEFIAVSPKIARELQEFKIPPHKIHLLPNPLSFSPLIGKEREKARQKWRQKWKLEDKFAVGFVANRLTGKGFELVVQALQYLEGDFQVVVVGNLTSRAQRQFQALLKKEKTGRVQYVGCASNMKEIYPAFDVLISPSRYESFGLAVYEALASAVPCIISKHIGLLDLLCPEVIRDMVMVVEDSPKEIAKALQRAQTSFCGSENLPSRLLLSQETDLKSIMAEVARD